MNTGLKTTAAGLGGLLLMAVAVENWRGEKEWKAFKEKWESKGVSFDVESVIPKAVPDGKNFAKIPLLEPLLDLEWNKDGTEGKPRDQKRVDRANAIMKLTGKPPKLGGWRKGGRVDLAAWQKYFREEKSWPSPAKPGKETADVLFGLKKHAADFKTLTDASRARPVARYDVNYRAHFAALIPHVAVLRNVSRGFTLRALARLEAGDAKGALEDVRMIFFLADSIKEEPMLISNLVRIAILEMALQPVWEGLASEAWDAGQLRALQARLGEIDLLENYHVAMRGERNLSLLAITDMRGENRKMITALMGEVNDGSAILMQVMPQGFFYQNQIRLMEFHLETTLPMVDAKKRRVFPEMEKAFERRVNRIRRHPYNLMVSLLMPAVGSVAKRAASSQTAVDLARVACGLEGFRKDNGRLPGRLAELTPEHLKTMPHDVVNGEALRFRRDGKKYSIYSVGWNGKDDGGKTVLREAWGSVDFGKGDWVWAK